jgi:hypothetical protein
MDDNNVDLIVSSLDRDARSIKMKIKRVVANIETSDVDKVELWTMAGYE